MSRNKGNKRDTWDRSERVMESMRFLQAGLEGEGMTPRQRESFRSRARAYGVEEGDIASYIRTEF